MAAIEVIITSAPFFILQILLLTNTKKPGLRLIPAYIVLLGIGIAAFLYTEEQLLGMGMLIAMAFYAAAVLLAWAVWGIVQMRKKNK